MKKVPTEQQEQIALIRWCRREMPDLLIFHIPNGGKREPREAELLRQMGVVSGIPDLFVPALKLFVELKRQKGGRPSPAQNKVASELERCGYSVVFCKGAAEAAEALKKALA